ncbi:hypothetical protein LCGC14_2112990 [marine sediment metagenome]|uniref:Uncharacterized protein n=1 Tax=marine sediment metagenome TaxID=412755 RepID=A0A0F9H2R5_9ZZZZ
MCNQSKRSKIVTKANWLVSERAYIAGATYRQALSYLVKLRVQEDVVTFDKPNMC